MSKKKDKKAVERRKLRKLEERSDHRSAEFLVRRLEGIQADLSDLIPDLQVFDHYVEIAQVSYCLFMLKAMKKKYEKRAGGTSWDDND